jgi:hypothetical protein
VNGVLHSPDRAARIRLPRVHVPRLHLRRGRPRAARAAGAPAVTGSLLQLRRAALVAIGVLVTAASATSFAESYRGLFIWAHHHGLAGVWAVGFPLQVDVFVAVGELALFVALADRWPLRSRAAAWTVTLLGLAASVAGNVGHIEVHSAAARATAAVPPLAAAAALAVGLGVLKRVVAMHGSTSVQPPAAPATAPAAPELVHPLALANGHSPPAPEPAALAGGHSAPARGYSVPDACRDAAGLFTIELAAGEVPSVREIRRVMHLGQPRAQQVHAHLTALATRGSDRT